MAVLSNVFDGPVKTVGTQISPFPGSGGFYIKLRDAGGKRAKYCAMINEENPAEHLLRPRETIVYRETVESLADEYCLGAGKYTAQVVYFNSLPAGVPVYSAPVISAALEIVVQNHRSR